MKNRAVILVNVGTPDSPNARDVRKYLSQFLNDPKVIDLPWLFRKILVGLVIVPFRAPRLAKLYRRLWTEKGSPLLVHLGNLVLRLQGAEGVSAGDNGPDQNYESDRESVPESDPESDPELDPESDSESGGVTYYGAMRYGNPSLADLLEKIRDRGHDRITVLPLYPQYSSSTTGSVIDLVNRITGKWGPQPEVEIISQFYRSPSFIKPMADTVRAAGTDRCDRVVFSYHGLPVRQIQKEHPACDPGACECDDHMPEHGAVCYRAACYETSRLLAAELGLSREQYITAFQSRLTRKWLQPFTDDTLVSLARSGARRVIIATPSFVADCLETTVEIGEGYRKLFTDNGGGELVLVRCLNEDLDMHGIL